MRPLKSFSGRGLGVHHQVAVEGKHILPGEQILRQIHAVNVVGLPVAGVVHEVEADGRVQREEVILQHVAEMTGGHHGLGHTSAFQQLHLPGDDGLRGIEVGRMSECCHALGMFLGLVAHAGAEAGIEQQCDHISSPE